MHKGEDFDCSIVISAMTRRLNILQYFSFGIESLWTSLTVMTEMF